MLEESSKAGCLKSSYLLWEHSRKAAVSERCDKNEVKCFKNLLLLVYRKLLLIILLCVCISDGRSGQVPAVCTNPQGLCWQRMLGGSGVCLKSI